MPSQHRSSQNYINQELPDYCERCPSSRTYLILACVVLSIFSLALTTGEKQNTRNRARVEIGGTRIPCEVVKTPVDRAKGLTGRAALRRGHGMLFVFEREDQHEFWMRDMRFPIDIIWIAGNRLVDIAPSVPPLGKGLTTTHRPRGPARYVLEVEAGTARDNGWKIDDTAQITFLTSPVGNKEN